MWSASLGVIEMPTDPFKQLFDLELSKAAAKERIEPAVTLIEEIRNYGHMLFARCAYRPGGGDENIAILFLYYHLLERLDAVGILVAESARSRQNFRCVQSLKRLSLFPSY